MIESELQSWQGVCKNSGIRKALEGGTGAELMETYGGANLDMILSNWRAIVHGVECSHLIDTHWRHLQYSCHLIHDAERCEAMLPLSKVKQGHNSRLFVLRGIPLDDLVDELVVLGRELERSLRVIDLRVSMLYQLSALLLAAN
jgi:hypothetical protein